MVGCLDVFFGCGISAFLFCRDFSARFSDEGSSQSDSLLLSCPVGFSDYYHARDAIFQRAEADAVSPAWGRCSG